MRYLILLFLLTGCGKNLEDFLKLNKTVKRSKTDPIFAPFVDSFKREFKTSVKVPIVLKSLKDKYAGLCLVYSDGYKEIQINKKHWDYYSYEQKEQLIYHELGHCVFNKGHDDSLFKKCPNSIMRSYMFSDYEINKCYLPEYEHYMEDLGR